MTDADGTYSRLAEMAKGERVARAPSPAVAKRDKPAPEPQEDLGSTPYISQNYRFTEDELRWLRRQSYSLSEQLAMKVSQNTVLRFALHALRDACAKSPTKNPLLDALSRLKK